LKELLFFSNNYNKVKEIKKIFRGNSIKIFSLIDFSINNEPKETGLSFAENAKLKSEFGFKKTNLACFADDSGICVEALDNRPGVLSKRFINKFKNKNECFKYIQKKVHQKNNSKAFFKSSICLTFKDNYNIVFEGIIRGTIAKTISGKNGFGYDPIFIPDGFNKTFSQMSIKEKNSISHRSIAVTKLINFLTN